MTFSPNSLSGMPNTAQSETCGISIIAPSISAGNIFAPPEMIMSFLKGYPLSATNVDNRYLIWVSDVITDGNYHAYYPAWIETSADSSTIKVLPVYPSGF
jgi:hypothetical protein